MISQNIKSKLKIPFISLFSFAFVLNVCTGCKETPETPLEQVDFKTCSWNDIKLRCDKLESEKISEKEFCSLFTYDSNPINKLDDFVGKERIIEVNKQPHRLRVIGTLHDVDENRKPLALTFEFANILSDEYGYSLAWQWNDIQSTNASYDFINSSIRKALNGTGSHEAPVYCASRDSYDTWDEKYTDVTILSMLPNDLQEVIKPTLKSVLIKYEVEEEEKLSTYKVRTRYSDKLFLLSNVEIGDIRPEHHGLGYGKVYKYYEEQTKAQDLKRIKTQVNAETQYIPSDAARIPEGSGQLFEGGVFNKAGYNYFNLEGVAEGFYLLSTGDLANEALAVFPLYGEVMGGSAPGTAYGVAPAFCI